MLSALMRASLDGALLAAAVWLVGRALPRLPPAARTMLWWCVAAKVLLALVWTAPVAVPILPAAAPTAQTALVGPPAARDPAPDPALAGATARDTVRHEASRENRWAVALLAVWGAGVLVSAGLLVRRWRTMRDAVRRSSTAPQRVHELTADLAARLGLRRIPDVRISGDVQTPLITGLRKPVVLLPDGHFDRLPARHQQMALCHELAHIRRADLSFGCVPACAERVFFFHPLIHLAAREYAFWREAACDAAVLDAIDAAPQEYGQLLLQLGIARQPIGLVAAGASSTFSSLKRRVVMLGVPSARSAGWRLATKAAVAAAFAALIPLQLTARPSTAAVDVAQPENVEVPPLENVAGLQRENVDAAQREGTEQKARGLNFVLFVDDDTTTMSGSVGDINRARRFKRPGERLLWFRRDGREYIVRDPALLQQIETIWIPVHEIGEQQGRIGEEQGKLGAKQGQIGERQGAIGAEQGALGGRQGRIGEKQAALSAAEWRHLSAADREKIEKERRQLDEEMRALDREMRALDVKMRELDQPMRELDAEMRELDEKMRVLDRKMDEASKEAEARMDALIRRAIESGAAEAVR